MPDSLALNWKWERDATEGDLAADDELARRHLAHSNDCTELGFGQIRHCDSEDSVG